MARLMAPILLGVVTILAIMLLTSDGRDAELEETFEIGAVYESGTVTVIYLDSSGKTDSAILEILGLSPSFQKTFSDSEFTEEVPFLVPPKNGWKAHPVVLDIEHSELGHVQLKTEVHAAGDEVPPVIYSRP